MDRIYLEDVIVDFFDYEYCRDFDLVEIFSDYSRTSYDDNASVSLIDSNEACFDFDKIKEFYIQKHNKKHKLISNRKNPGAKFTFLRDYSSNDAIKKIDGMDFFVEFKNEASPKKNKIESKIRESMLIYLDIMDVKISYTRENLGYILVYNPSKSNKDTNVVGQHKNFDIIQGKIKSFAKEKVDKFGLVSNYEDFYFKEVKVLSKEEFTRIYNL
ncbi:hypothetical protein [Anaerococcus sp. Marseille-Q7828]|uniref:hypothetical protein n=1 Tax=Anaerococcus sp. Marseille-Q7828 TaxID=3036300 RepID=UPI0024AE3A6D|nr:hypothetical protein [Anaerococcus sp. Marseille-Q7828]